MALFFISFVLVFLSSYLITSVITEKKSILGLIYFLLIPFANIVLTFEILSLFSAISQIGVLALNIITFAVSVFVWNKYKRPLWNLEWKPFFKRLWNSLSRDKYLAVLAIGFIIMIYVSLFLMSFMPVINADADAYHVLRSVCWISNGNLNHFSIADSRNLILPINSEILYAWVILFVKKQVWLGFFAFTGYILSVVSVYNFMKLMKFSMRKALWVIFLLSSFASVIVQISGTETDIIIAGLVSSSLFLFWRGVKDGKIVPIFMSALAYALAVGTKTPSIMAIPGIALAMTALAVYYRKKEFYKPLLQFLGFASINFILFAAYNYVQNFITYGSIIGSNAFIEAHSNSAGIKAIPANFIKYLFLFFDFTGFHWGNYFGDNIIALRDNILSFLHLADIQDGIYTTENPINQTLLEPLMGLGILGFLVFLPCWFWALIKPIFKRSKQTWFLFAFAFLLVINIAVMSYELQFMAFSVRFLMFFCVLSVPVIVYSYCKRNNPYKFIIVCFAMFYLVLVSTHLWARPYKRVIKYLKAGYTITEIREIGSCAVLIPDIAKMPPMKDLKKTYHNQCVMRDSIMENYAPENKILFFASTGTELLKIKALDLKGYHIDFGLMEDVENIDLSKYNLIITIDNQQFATNILHYEERKNDASIDVKNRNIIYKKNKSHPCFYMNTKNEIISDVNNPSIYPYMSSCTFTNEFYKQNNFKFAGELKMEVPAKEKGEEPMIFNYYFYENLANPIKEMKPKLLLSPI